MSTPDVDQKAESKQVDVTHLEALPNPADAHNPNARVILSDEEKKLVRKIDAKILPIMCAVGFLQFLDKTSLSYASVLGIIKDTNLQGSEYALLGSLFYIGYLTMQLPNSYLMQRFPLGRLVGTIVFLWGIVLACTSLGKNFSELAGLRFLLGFFEACVNPIFIMLTNTFYRKQEQVTRIGAWWLFNGFASSLGGLVGYGIGQMDGVKSLWAWQWIMIILGSITCVVGIVVFFVLIDDPYSARLHLTEDEKLIVADRLVDNGVYRTQEFKKDQVIEALKDQKTWIFFFCALLNNMTNGALTTFSTLITQGFGFSGLNSILLQMPSGICDVILILIAGWIHSRTGDRLFTCVGLMVIAEVGLILLVAVPSVGGKLCGLYLTYGYAAAYVLVISSVAANTNGYTKKLVTNAMMIIGYTVGNIIGPVIMIDGPKYVGGMVGCISANFVMILLMIYLRFSMARDNKRRAALGGEKLTSVDNDITDRQDPNFVYRL
ncbi:hypothetical protein INT44_005112 [Umbelopsis vinacea]|uniref:Major facilitator superfamily (MFS) profile domain-containing protein n=1 Tax=Umbelopsis vinacea TaxID=44442 RepID=A0A8H7Q6K2_9FUNG|nr:hypothetical protein INT44_005112 [Umbelopsis vinacea]